MNNLVNERIAKRVWQNCKGRISTAFREYNVPKELRGSVRELIGCSKEELVNHIESTFYGPIEWFNYGPGHWTGWEVDHIKPIRDFDLTNPEQQKQCFHYTNLRALLMKGNRAHGRGRSYKGSGARSLPVLINFA